MIVRLRNDGMDDNRSNTVDSSFVEEGGIRTNECNVH